MRVFITGATGVIGSRAVPLLLQAGHAVTAASRSEHNREALRRAGAAPADVDLFDVDSVRRVIAGHDVVINLATHIPSSAVKIMIRWAWRTNDRIRREASAAIATAAIEEGVGRMIQESFALIYPDRGDAWIDESMPVAPDELQQVRARRRTLGAALHGERWNWRGPSLRWPLRA